MYAALVGEMPGRYQESITESNTDDVIDECVEMCRHLAEYISCIIVTLGKHGALLVRSKRKLRNEHLLKLVGPAWSEDITGDIGITYYPSKPPTEPIVSVSGAGDSLTAAVISGILRSYSPERCLQAGIAAATLSLSSHFTISPSLSHHMIFGNRPSQDFHPHTWRTISTK